MIQEGGIRIVIQATPPGAWETLLAADSRADYFHTTHWLESICRCHDGVSPLWILADSSGHLVGGLGVAVRAGRIRTRLDSSMDGTSGGPVIDEDLTTNIQREVFTTLLDRLDELRKGPLGIATVSLNKGHEAAFGDLLAARSGWRRRDVPAAVIPLIGGPGHIEANLMKKNKRNERNRGLRRGCEVFATDDVSLLDAYYPIYQQANETWGLTPTPLAFLRALLADPLDRVFFTCVRVEGQVIGGHLNLHLGGRVMAWNGVTDPAYARSHFPATVAVWGDIVEACRRGAGGLDLGASGGVVSLSSFKQYFGAREEVRGFYSHPAPLFAGLDFLRTRLRGSRTGGARRWHDHDPGTGGP